MRLSLKTGVSALCCLLAAPAFAQDSGGTGTAVEPAETGTADADVVLASVADGEAQDLADLSIEQLAQIQVRSASKRAEPLNEAPAALYVITEDVIESLGIHTLPEALRLAPNLSVQRVDATQYSIAARGFNGLQAGNKVLALIDGRSIYTPLASSVFWNLHWPLVEDLQQIEVISGPGGTLYGPNAVNGVINVTSRDAQETLGTLVRGTAGARGQSLAARQGFALGQNGAIRVYANWHHRSGLAAGVAPDFDDEQSGWQAGFRSDFVTESDHFTLQGDIFKADADTLPGDGAHGHNLLARWSRTLSETSSLQVQAYYDRFKREFLLVDDSVTTIDAEAQFNAALGAHELVAGVGVRTTNDEFINNANFFQLVPVSDRLWVFSGFVQDQVRVSDTLSLIAGVKLERSTFSGWQVLPNLRVAYQPSEDNLLWAAVSRAVRTPNRIDQDLQGGPLAPGLPPFLLPAPQFESEKLVAVEAGYRGQPSSSTTVSVNGFVNFYNDLRSTELTPGGSFQLQNGRKGTTYGFEAWGTAQLMPHWRASLGVATLWKNLDMKDARVDFAPRNTLGNDPNWQVIGRTEFDLTPRLQLAINARAVGKIEQPPAIDSYVEAGGQLSFRATDRIDLFVAGRNLLHKQHLESNDPGMGQAVKRAVYAGARARF